MKRLLNPKAALIAIAVLFAVLSCIGITWGLPDRSIDKYLFGEAKPWSGKEIYRLAGAGEKLDTSSHRGADVDVNPLSKIGDAPIPLTATKEDVAGIYLRYRLYTYQPDEMITMMALAGMDPSRLDLDPRLYQYGGLFIYPIGAIIRLCGMLGLIDVRSDVIYYLDHPEQFGKFYIVARAYAAAWGIIGVLVVFAIARRLGGVNAGLLAALLFALMPVVVCMSHEGKPHLPGAVLMLLAVLSAMRYLTHGNANGARRHWWTTCLCCGAALGMVLSSAPIIVLIPIVAWIAGRRNLATGADDLGIAKQPSWITETFAGVAAAAIVYLTTNPYIVINALSNREVLASNFGNSLAMYQIARLGEGFVRVLELTVEGATLPILVLGVIACVAATVRRNRTIAERSTVAILAIPAAIFFAQFVLIGAGKPAEYGRFGIFTNTALAIATACCVMHSAFRCARWKRYVAGGIIVVWVGLFGAAYLMNFHLDATDRGSRVELAQLIANQTPAGDSDQPPPTIFLRSEPAPYGCPPLDFASRTVQLVPARAAFPPPSTPEGFILVETDDAPDAGVGQPFSTTTPISWANKPFVVMESTDARHDDR